MTTMQWDGGDTYEMTFERQSNAPASVVYDVLTDLSTHLEWAGKRQYPGFRLLSVRGDGPLEAGTTFTSVGSVPMSLSRSENENEVIEARRPEILEFHTNALIVWRSGKRTEARYGHRFEIEADGTGSRVVYRLRQTSISNPPLRIRLPVMRIITHRVMIPMFCRRGFVNLLRTAGRRGSPSEPARAVSGS
jgi:Polyketide cyclase / dehydrase and lipid transport